MTLRAVFIADGSSDLPLATLVSVLCQNYGLDVEITTPDPARLPAASRSVRDRLSALLRIGDPIDLIFVHRDAEGAPAEVRRDEIARGAAEAGVSVPVMPVVPVRMTEAWLLLDEAAIRIVAGKPHGTTPLDLPPWHKAESIPDPKTVLKMALLDASGATGRRRRQLDRDFSRLRADLLRRLQPTGRVTQLASWQQLVKDLAALAEQLPRRGT